jgi:hypothetical protein
VRRTSLIRIVLTLGVIVGFSGLAAPGAWAAPTRPARPVGGPRTATPLKPPSAARAAQRPALSHTSHLKSAHTISSCPGEITAAGTYNVTANLTDAGSYCIWIAGDDVTVNLNGHTITGTGSDDCIAVEDQSATSPASDNPTRSIMDDTINGAKGRLTDCGNALYSDYSSRTVASNLTIATPDSDGVVEDYSTDNTYSNVNVADGSSSTKGYYMYGGSANHITGSAVASTGSPDSFYLEYEYDDLLLRDIAKYPNGPGGSGDGFVDYYSNRNAYVDDKAYGQLIGFYLYNDDYGTVAVANDLSSNPGENATGSYGFYDYYGYDDANYGRQNHSVYTYNTAIGGQEGFYDEYNIAETFTHNQALGASTYGFFFYYPADYIVSDNTSNGTYNKTAYGASTYGFYIYEGYSYYSPERFTNNTSENNYYGFYSVLAQDGFAIHGTGNKAINDTNDSLGVEVS